MKKAIQAYIVKWIGKRLNVMFFYAPKRAIDKALRLFITPRRGRLTASHYDFLRGAKNESLRLEGHTIQTYYWPGNGPCVLLVHGWESNAARWRTLIPQLLSQGYAVVGLDAPAHGGSSGKHFNVPFYGRVVAKVAEKYQPTFAVGHSLGGMTLLFQQAQAPLPHLKKMVLLAPAIEMQNIMADFQIKLALKPALMEALNKRFVSEFGYGFNTFTMLKYAKYFHFPALFIHDRADKIVNWQESKQMVQSWSQARLLVTEGLGHRLRDDLVDYETVEFLKV